MVSALEIDKKLWVSSSKHLLMNEAQKYQTSLKPEFFLSDFVDKTNIGLLYDRLFRMGKFDTHTRKILDKEMIRRQLLSHPLLKELPWGSSNVKKDAKKFIARMKDEIGIFPSAYYCFGPDENSCFVETSEPLSLLIPENEFYEVLKSAYNFWIERHRQGENDTEYFNRFSNTMEISEWLGLLSAMQTDIFGLRTRFSTRTKDILYQLAFMFTNAAGKEVCINLVYVKNLLNWRFILRKTQAKYNDGIVRHDFGYSLQENLPLIRQTPECIEIIFEPPIEFLKIFRENKHSSFKGKLVIRLSLPVNSRKIGFLNEQQIDFVIKLLFEFSLLIVFGIYLGRFSSLRSLKVVVTLAFFAGSMVPLSGLTWFGISYLNSQKQFEAKRMFEFLKENIQEAEKKITLQKTRNVIFYSIMTDRISRMNLEQRKKFPLILKQSSESNEHSEKYYRRPFIGYYLLNEDGSECFDLESSDDAMKKQMKTFFGGTFTEFLLRMGGFNHLDENGRQKLAQRVEMMAGITDGIVETEKFRNMLEFEGQTVPSSITSRGESLTAFILARSKNVPDGLISFFSNTGSWERAIKDIINKKQFPVRFFHNGYKITLSFFPLDSNNVNSMAQIGIDNEIISLKDHERFYKLAKALYANSENAEIDNLEQNPPSLILTQVIANQDVFAMAYAEKVKTALLKDEELLIFVAIIFALISSFVLAKGTARILLVSIPAFVQAIDEVQNRNFLWELKISSGDEFEELAKSFNIMGRKLLEREKMSQLVSENVMQAISCTDASMLKPGGEKREATILFSDIRSFTTLSEKYKAEEIVEMLNSYFTVMAEVIVENGGIIDKLIGDAIQAVFYQSADKKRSEIRASVAAVEMQKQLKTFNSNRKKQGLFTVNNGFGISTGVVISGRVGTETGKLDATVIGKTLNRAEHLESLSKNARQSNILIDKTTLAGLEESGLRAKVISFKSDESIEAETFELLSL